MVKSQTILTANRYPCIKAQKTTWQNKIIDNKPLTITVDSEVHHQKATQLNVITKKAE